MSRDGAQLTVAAFEKKYLNYYVTAQIKKDIMDDIQQLRELESKENL
jgi:hypothetical protein